MARKAELTVALGVQDERLVLHAMLSSSIHYHLLGLVLSYEQKKIVFKLF
jgi:hypothetical protein